MSPLLRHVVLPSIPAVVIVGLYFTPVSLIGCVNRGLIALSVAVLSLIVGIAVGVAAARTKLRGEPISAWHALSMVLYAIPALLLIGPLG